MTAFEGLLILGFGLWALCGVWNELCDLFGLNNKEVIVDGKKYELRKK